nr:PREDICTED: signal-induced proliferation-associated 1-like protein 1 [Latimeria chalumnae]|eukprot:XP_006013999.1 PREDICTED: signal-induced proliferation-associated 1-like protein 1 [Latimeria chalumnae]
MPLPDTAAGLEWANLVNAAKAFEDQRASLFSTADGAPEPDTGGSVHKQTVFQSSSPDKALLGDKLSPTLTSKVNELEATLMKLQEDLKKEKQDKANLEAEVQHLREDNMRLLEESQNASAKLKKFTEWVFNTIDMN